MAFVGGLIWIWTSGGTADRTTSARASPLAPAARDTRRRPGIDTVYVSAVLGHSTPAITANVYQHARPERLDQAVLQVGNAIFGR
jgi:integrase